MRPCAKQAEHRGPALPWAAALVLLLSACGDADQSGRFELGEVEARWSNGRMEVRFEQDLSLSPEARNALVHGVPLTVGVELILRDAKTQTRLKKNESFYEIRYLPLSEHYQLTGPGDYNLRTFPRLRHALAELGDLQVQFETGALPSGEYELLARSFLDKQKMPPPMRLPVMFSSRWKHESAWSSSQLEIEPEA
jgi:hypothetical protein